MAEQRRKAQVRLSVLGHPPGRRQSLVGARPGRPAVSADRMSGRTHRQQVQQRGLVVALPIVVGETLLRSPAHGHPGRPHLRPVPVDAGIDVVDQRPDQRLVRVGAVEPRLAMQHAGEEQRGVDGRQLAGTEAGAGLRVEEMVEEALVAGHARRCAALGRVVEEADRRQHAGPRLLPGDEAPLRAGDVGGEAEAHRRDAGEGWGGPAVEDEAGGGVGGFPEEVEGAALEIGEHGVGGQGRKIHRRRDAVGAAGRERRREKDREQIAACEVSGRDRPWLFSVVHGRGAPCPRRDPMGHLRGRLEASTQKL